MQNYTNTTQYKSIIDAINNGNTEYISNLDEPILSRYLINFITNEDPTESNCNTLMSIMTYTGKLSKYSINKIYQQAVCQNKIIFANPLNLIRPYKTQEDGPHSYDHFFNPYSLAIKNLVENKEDKLYKQNDQDMTIAFGGGIIGTSLSAWLFNTFTNKYTAHKESINPLSTNEKMIVFAPGVIGVSMFFYGVIHSIFANDDIDTPGLNAMCNLIGESTYNFDDTIE